MEKDDLVNNAEVHQMIFVQAPSHQTKRLALQEHWEENIPSYLKVEEDMFFSVQSIKNIAKFLFLTSQL